MHGVALLLAAAALGHLLARASRLPVIPCLLLSGVVLSLVHVPSPRILEDTLSLGAALLVFVTGLELDPARLRAQRRVALRVGALQFGVLGALGFGAAVLLGYDSVEAGYLALALAASSTLVGVRLLQRRRQLFEPFGRLVLGVLLVQDTLVILLVPLVGALGGEWDVAISGLAAALVLGAASHGVRRWLAPLLLRAQDDEEVLLLGTLVVLFLFMGGAAVLRLPLVVGAFLAGASLSRFPVDEVVRVELAPVGDFFTAIFLVALGAVVGLPRPEQMLHAGVLATVVLVATPLLVLVVAERTGFSTHSAMEAGLMLAQTSEISLVVGLSALGVGHLSEAAFSVVALVTAGTLLLTPFLSADAVAWRLTLLHPSSRRRRTAGDVPGGHVVLLGCGTTGASLLDFLILRDREVVVVDEDPAVLNAVARAGVRTVRGDASDAQVLRRAGVDAAAAVVSTIRRPRKNAEVLERVAGSVPVLVRVFEEADARWVEGHGGTPVLYADATARVLLHWYDAERTALDRSFQRRMGVVSGTPAPA